MSRADIKASELRIGNLLQRKSNGNICTVTWGVIKDIENGEGKDYEPIPLTEWWQKNYGYEFTKIDKGGFFLSRFFFEDDLILDGKGNLFYRPDNCFHGTTLICHNIEYVHQLQNLFFSLKNKELKRKCQKKLI